MNKEDTYKHFLLLYGITTILLTLRHYEVLEDYEECQQIIKFLKAEEIRLKTKLHTRLTTEFKEEVLGLYKEVGLTGENFIENAKTHSKTVIDEINKLKEKVK